jgi:hypothetical protein
MALGAAAGYFGLGLSLILYFIFKLSTRMESIDGKLHKE